MTDFVRSQTVPLPSKRIDGGLLSEPSNALRWAMLALAVPLVICVVTIPLSLQGQLGFALGTIAAVMLLDTRKGQRATVEVSVLALLASTRYIYWRTTATLEFNSPLEWVLGIGLWLAEFYAWLILVLGLVQTTWPLHRMPIPLQGAAARLPTVDVFIPTYNEPLDIVRTTVFNAMNMDYPRERFRVYILDDGKRPEFREFAQEVGCGYLTRPDNLHAKAGNLNAAMKHTDGDLICVFDCDHVPTRAFLQLSVGWFQVDRKLALLQTPHFFYTPDPVQKNVESAETMPGEGELFYGSVQAGNDLWNATFFCGSCAVIRREALDQTHGFAGETVTEDAHTALKLQRMGWGTAYLNIRLSAGLATDKLSSHIGQRIRWARGMMQIFRIDNPLFGPGLSFTQRLCYLNAMLHFMFPLPRITFLTSPLAYLLADQSVIHASAALIFAYAAPHLYGSTLTTRRVHGAERRPFWGEVHETLLAFHLVRPTIMTFLSPHKGKFNVTAKGDTSDRDYFDWYTLRPHLIAAAVLAIGMVAGVLKLIFPHELEVNPATVLLNISWTLFNLLILLAAISVGRETRQARKDARFEGRLPVTLYCENGYVIDAETVNLSLGGVALHLPDGFDAQDRKVTEMTLGEGPDRLTVPVQTVAAAGPFLRVSFGQLAMEQERLLAHVLMGRADTWNGLYSHRKVEKSLESMMGIAKLDAATLLGLEPPVRRKKHAIASQRTPYSVSRLRHMVFSILSSLLIIALIVAAFMVLGSIANAQEAPRTGSNAAGALVNAASSGVHLSDRPGSAPLPAAAQAGGKRHLRMTLKDLQTPYAIRLAGTQAEVGIPFGLRQDEVVTGASLTLNFAYSPALLPTASHLIVIVNGEIVRTLLLPQETANGVVVTIPIDPALLLPGDNRLNLRFIGHSRRDCEDPLDASIWANVSNVRSAIDLDMQKLPPKSDLAGLPRPFFDAHATEALVLPFVFAAAPSNGELEAAGSVAGWFGGLASYRGFSFKPAIGQIPTGNAVVFVTPGRPLAGLNLPSITGPAVASIANPNDPFGTLLVVMGRDERDLKQAAGVLATSTGLLGGAQAAVGDATVPVLPAYAAPRWVRTDKPVRLGDIVDPADLQGLGLPPGPLTADFRISPDLFFWPHEGAKIAIGYTYPQAPWLDRAASRLDLSLNRQYLKSFRLTDKGWFDRLLDRSGVVSAHNTGGGFLPSYMLYGANQLSFYFDMVLSPEKRKCQGTLPTDVKTAIDADSTLDLTAARHAALLPNLALFAGGGFPFTRTPDLGETAVILRRDPAPADIEAYLAAMGRFGDATGASPTRVTVLRNAGEEQLRGKDVLVIGPASLAEGALFAKAPVQWSNGQLTVAGRSIIDRIFAFLSPETTDSSDTVNQSLLAASNFEGIVGFRSPFSSDRSVVALLATQPELLPTLVYRLADSKVNAQVQGDLALLTGDGMTSFHIAPRYWWGDFPLRLRIAYWFTQRPLLLAVGAVIAALLIAMPAYLMLKARERSRLKAQTAREREAAGGDVL